MRVTTDERERYDRDGFFVRENAFDRDEVDRMIDAAEELCRDLVAHKARTGNKVHVSASSVFEPLLVEGTVIKWEPGAEDTVKGIEPFAHLHPYFAKIAEHPGFVEPMRDLVGVTDVGLFTEKLNVKRAGVGVGYALHRDFPYWEQPAEQPERLVTALVALDGASAENGALEVLPGSHLLGELPAKESEKVFERNEIDPEQIDTSALVSVDLAPGSVVFFGPHLVHRSRPNRSDRDRRALLYTYQPAGLRTQRDNWLAHAERA